MDFDSRFRQARRSRERVDLSDGTTVEMPLLTERASLFSAFFTIDARKARALLPPGDLRPVRASARRALLSVQVMEYTEKSIDPYREFVVSIPVHRSRVADLPFVSAGLMERLPGAGAYLTHIAVTTEESRRVGREVLGFPKFLCEVELTSTDSERVGEVAEGGRSIFTLAIRRPASHRRHERDFYSYSLGPDDNLLYRIPYQYSASVGFRFGRRSARLHLGDHPVSHELRDLGISPAPLLSLDAPQFALISNLPEDRIGVGDWLDPRALYRERRAGGEREPAAAR